MARLFNKLSIFFVLNLFVSFISPALAGASPTSLILITELQTGQGSSEFIEIENTSDSTLNLTGWRLQYHSSASTSWTTKTLTFTNPVITSFKAGDRALLLAAGYSPPGALPIATFASGISDTGGSIRIVPTSLDESQGDKLTWGTTDTPTCSIAPKHSDGQSLKRYPSGDGAIVDTSISGKDFYVSNSPSPDAIDIQDPFSIDEVVNYCGKPVSSTSPDATAPGAPEDPGAPQPISYQRIEITELFPDPVSPQTDENDEYIELFNPNTEPVDLTGYKLQTGMNSTYSYIFGGISIQPGEYYAVSRKDSKLTLSNTSSKARLLNPSDEVISETEAYDQTSPAESWQLYDGVWQWSSTPTPSSVNIQLNTAASTTLATKVSAKPATKTTKQKKTPAAKTPKKSSLSAKPSQPKQDPSANAFTYTDDTGTTRLQPYIIWGAGILLFGYGLWEYRWDLLGALKRNKAEI